jgi:hypothetical protein
LRSKGEEDRGPSQNRLLGREHRDLKLEKKGTGPKRIKKEKKGGRNQSWKERTK